MAAYHAGERAVQRRAGLEGQAAMGGRAIGATIPDVAAAFLAHQPMIAVGAAGQDGRIWASLLTGAPGFLRSDDPATLTIATRPIPGDPLAGVLAGPAKVGMIAIEPATRRRMRINGTSLPEAHGLRVVPDQVLANCPKYIQKRDHSFVAGEPRTPRRGTELTDAQRRAIGAADTFFVATAAPDGDADTSHRGGAPGFVQVLSPTRLRWPDYVGNAMFLTLGNLELRPEAGLLFPDWKSGTLLQLTGTARTVWDTAGLPGAQRLVEFSIDEVRETAQAVPLRWTDPAYSRFNPPVA
ncbi:pyridoxamine 5'-phosphate oxidase family protein [Actinoallomurus spadix]|uniref:Pyridoxamine 5'-phosphate oxidase family protein n=1 Tax=Actinoallomurus spadix TaxID=79912 RepID=A0ABN0VPD1_9ACTN|nr:pyridoxamine 5'-phosphate oxidase family protein [Actinoallomurus spadix]MCO5991227.1 pyridoxamine 5'-phosphate oxidase family protein [Actinoallomurus spadix]